MDEADRATLVNIIRGELHIFPIVSHILTRVALFQIAGLAGGGGEAFFQLGGVEESPYINNILTKRGIHRNLIVDFAMGMEDSGVVFATKKAADRY